MAGQDDDTDKSFEPTPHKIQEARRKGDVPKSQDLNATAAYLGLLIALLLSGGTTLPDAGTALMVFLDQSAQMAFEFSDGGGANGFKLAFFEVLPFLATLFGLPILFVLLSAIGQQSVTFAPDKIAPKLSRINPIKNAGQKYGITGLFEFAKSTTKLIIFAICLALFISIDLERIISTSMLQSHQALMFLADIGMRFLMVVIAVTLAIGAIDFIFQIFDHRRKLRMSHKEIKDEVKQNEGDPHLKQERQARGREIALEQNIADVATASVVITNPTHYAVALQWDGTPGTAPICVCKGVDEVAKVIRETAVENGVPLHADPPTARALYSTTLIGEQIPPELYRAVATAIRFAEAIRQKVKARVY